MNTNITIRDGSVYLDADFCQEYFDRIDNIVLLKREDDILLLPIREPGAGGLLMKIKNARGDRVVHAPETLSQLGLESDSAKFFRPIWDQQLGGFRLSACTTPQD